MSGFTRYSSLAGRTVLITGGATGIGQAIVRGFAANGARIAFLDVQDEPARVLVDLIVAAGAPKPLYLHCDLLDIPAVKAAIAGVRKALGPASVLVNNAANDRRMKFDEVTPEMFDWSIGVNLRHVFFACQAVAPQMRELGFGSIINMSSGVWIGGAADMQGYSAAKAAIVGLTNSLARELGPYRIRVNAIAPGLVLTEKQRKLWFPPEKIAEAIAEQCLHEEMAPEDIAHMALFLAADDSRLISKQCFLVNAGRR